MAIEIVVQDYNYPTHQYKMLLNFFDCIILNEHELYVLCINDDRYLIDKENYQKVLNYFSKNNVSVIPDK